MKPLIKIIVLSIVAIILIAIMVTIIATGANIGTGWLNLRINTAYYYDDDNYSIGEAELSGELEKLDISWVSGSVKIEAYDGDKIIITESVSEEIEEKYKLRYIFDDGALHIKYQESGIFNWFRKKNAKELTVKIPEQYLESMDKAEFDLVDAKLELCDIISDVIDINSVSGAVLINNLNSNDVSIESVSGKIEVAMLSSKKADIQSASGEIKIIDCEITSDFTLSNVSGVTKILDGNVENLEIEAVSGSINVNCQAERFDCNTVSGTVAAVFANCPKEMDVESVSGNSVISIADNEGFTAICDSLSGKISIEGFTIAKNDDKYVYQNGGNEFNFESLSGNITIKLLS